METNFQLLLRKYTEDLYLRIFPESGVFRGGVISSSAVDTIDISAPLEGSNSEGKDVVFDPSLGSQVPFENENAIPYYVGLRHVVIPADVEINVRTGKYKYVFKEEAIGERADPDLVVDDGDGTMTIRVNSVTEINVDHSGRTVRVFMKATEDGGAIGPQTLVTPFEDLVVQYDGVNNFVETTTGIGQVATSISTTVNDYECVLIGPSIKRNVDLRLIDEVIFLGIVTGTGTGTSPTVFDQADRRVLSAGGGGGGGGAQTFQVFETVGTMKHSDVTVGQVTWSDTLYYRPFGSSQELEVVAGNITLADDEVAYLQIPDPFIGGTVVLQISPRSSVGLQSADRFWVFHRTGNHIKVRTGMQLEQGEERQLDDVVIGGVLNFGNDDKLRFDDTTNIFHFDADGSTDNANIAIGSSLFFGDPTSNDKLLYSAGLLSVLLNNAITGTGVSAGYFTSQRALATDTSFEALVTGDAVPRYVVQADGGIEWGDGTGAADTDLFRSAAGILETTNIMRSASGQFRLNDVDLTRETASLVSIASNFRIAGLGLYYGVASNNDLMRFVEGATPFFEFVTNNIQRFRIDELGNGYFANNATVTGGTVTYQDVLVQRESATLLGLIADLRISTGILRAGLFANNDLMRFVEGGTPIWEFITNNIQRWKVSELGDSTSSRDSLSQSGTVYLKPSTGVAVTAVDASLNEVYDRTKSRNLLRITANNVADQAINIASGRLSLSTADEVGLVNSELQVVTFAGGTINFNTGVNSAGDNFTPYTPSAGNRFFKYGMILNSDNQIVVLLPTTDYVDKATSDADTAEPIFEDGTPLGSITVESLSTTPGDIQVISEAEILQFAASGAGGGGALNDFKLKKVVGTTLTLGKGVQALVGGYQLITGTDTLEDNLPIELSLNLNTINGGAPANDTTYWLYIDKYVLEDPITLTDSGRQVIRVKTEADFILSTTVPEAINKLQYLPIGSLRSDNAAGWDGTGSIQETYPVLREQHENQFWNLLQKAPTSTNTSQANIVFAHGLSGKPDSLTASYFDGSTEVPIEASNLVVDMDETNVTWRSDAYAFGSGEIIYLNAFFKEPGNSQVSSSQTQKVFGPYTDAATLSVAHGMAINDIKDISVIENDITSGKWKTIGNDLVLEYDETNLTLDWSGLTPTVNRTYTIVVGGSPLPASIPIQFGGFTKFVGFGPGSYTTLTAAIAGSVPGDSILINKSYTTAVQEVINLDDIRIKFMPGVKISSTAAIAESVIKVTGDRVDMDGLHLEIAFAGTQVAGLRVESDDCNIRDSRINANDAGLTLTDAYLLHTGSDLNYLHGSVRTIGTVTNTVTDNGGPSNAIDVRG